MKQKRVLVIHHAAEYGGGSKGALIIGKMLRENNCVVEYLIPDYKSDFHTILQKNGFKSQLYHGRMGGIFNYVGGPKKVSRTFFKNLFNINKTKRNMKEIFQSDYDIVIVNSSVMCWMGKHIHGKKICFIRENVSSGFWKLLEKHEMRYFDKLAFISEYDKQKWGNQSCGALIRDCVRVEEQHVKPLKQIKKILYLGGDSEIKGWRGVKALLKEMNDYEFLIAGYVSEKEKYEAPHIHYYGMVENVKKLYDMADLVLLPSIVPHQLMPIYEAGLYGKVVITTDFKIMREHIQNNHNGILIPKGDIEAISKTIRELSDDLQKCNLLIQNNHKRMQEHKYEVVKKDLLHMIETL